MRTPMQAAVAAALFAGAAAIAVAQQPHTIPSTTAPTSGTAPQASSEVNRNQVGQPIASMAAGAPNAQAAQSLVEALNADASLKGSKLTVVPEPNGLLVTGVTPSLRQMAQIVNTANQQAGGMRVSHSISTEEVVIDVGAMAASPENLIPPDQIEGDAQQDPQQTAQAEGMQQAPQQQEGAQQAPQQQEGVQPASQQQAAPQATAQPPSTDAQPTAQAQPAGSR